MATVTLTEERFELASIAETHRSTETNVAISGRRSTDNGDPPPANAVTVVPPTQITRDVVYKLLSAAFAFFVAGINDGSLGALTPYLLRSYEISTGLVAVVYLSTFAGFVAVAFINNFVRMYLGTGGIITVGAVLQLIALTLRPWTPPFPLFAITFFLTGSGIAFQDSQCNSFVSSVKGAHRWLGFMHGMYGIGALIAPFVATFMASKMPDQWCLFYTIPVALCALNLVVELLAFRDSFSSNTQQQQQTPRSGKHAFQETIAALKLPGFWQLSLFYFCHVGAGLTAGGWVVEYLVRIRKGELEKVGYVSAGFYSGFALGRLGLAEITHRWGERRMVLIWSSLLLVLQLIGWLVPNIAASATAVSLMGMFMGPCFAAGISVASRLWPSEMQPVALVLIFVFSQTGGAMMPSLTGLIAAKAGVQVLQPILLGLIALQGVSWYLVSKVNLHAD